MVFVRLDLEELEEELGVAAEDVALEVANELVNNLTDQAPTGATGNLRRSFQIFRTSQGEVWLGSRLHYAEGVWKGTGPHTPDFDALRVWARRKLNDESAAGPVFRKIQQEGTDPNPFVDDAIDETLDRIGQFTLERF